MPAFTSSAYLGLRHGHEQLPPWRRLTTGVPAALGEPAVAGRVARSLANLVGADDAVLSRSTLHAFWDVADDLSTRRRTGVVAYVDDCTYAVARFALAGVPADLPVLRLPHHDIAELSRRLTSPVHRDRRPVVVTDGYCPGCGPAPLADYAAVLEPAGGFVVVDDTQALGVLGRAPSARDPYGSGGGGSLQWGGVSTGRAVVVASLAKGFGAPLAVTAGPRMVIDRVRRNGPSRAHTSPPSMADLFAAEAAIEANGKVGDQLRRRLAALVARLRDGLNGLGVAATPDNFPVQATGPYTVAVGRRLHARLVEDGIDTVLQRQRCRPGALVTFVVTARHRSADIDRAVDRMEAALAALPKGGRDAA